MAYQYKYECLNLTCCLTLEWREDPNTTSETPRCLYGRNLWAESADLEANCPFYADQAQPIQQPHTEKLNQLTPRVISLNDGAYTVATTN